MILSALKKENDFEINRDRINQSLLSIIALRTGILPGKQITKIIDDLDEERITNILNKKNAPRNDIADREKKRSSMKGFDFMIKAYTAIKKVFGKKDIEKANKKS